MNNVNIIGRTTSNIELKKTSTTKSVVTFNVAVNRPFKDADGEYQADFISCVAWDKTADLLHKYVNKGHQVGIEGRLQTRTYEDKDKKTVYVTEVVVDKLTLLEKKEQTDQVVPDYAPSDFVSTGKSPAADDDMPF